MNPIWVSIISIGVVVALNLIAVGFFMGKLTQAVTSLETSLTGMKSSIDKIADEIKGYTLLFVTKEDLAEKLTNIKRELSALWNKHDGAKA